MGFLNGLMKSLGFESDSKKQNTKQEEEKEIVTNKAEYDLTNISQNEDIKEFRPQTQVEIQDIVNLLKNDEVVCVNLQDFDKANYTRALDFLSGAIYVLNGKIKRNGDKTFIFYPNVSEEWKIQEFTK